MQWDEENRLTMLSEIACPAYCGSYTSRYTYNHGGERVIKSHGGSTGVFINANPQGILYHDADNYTLYVSPYMVVSKERFTKHYYSGTQRVASKLGVGDFNNLFIQGSTNVTAGQKDYSDRMKLMEQSRNEHYAGLGIPPGPPTNKGIWGEPETSGAAHVNGTLGKYDIPGNWPRPPIKNEPGDVPGPPVQYGPAVNPNNIEPGYGFSLPLPLREDDIYFYHSDHLGSTSYVTDGDANPTQFICYIPFGEAFIDEHSTRPGMPYKFNGKEQDAETGLLYYGARYYDPKICVWYGVDPLAEKYAGISSYAYVANNPIKYIDPDGRDIIPVHGTWSGVETWKNLNSIQAASNNLFGDKTLGNAFPWSGGNYAESRIEAALGLIDHARAQMKSKTFNGEITLVGHSHGGNVSIEALNMMAEMKEFDNVQLNLLTINTPVREDYQLSEKATGRVNHVNVYDPKDPVQSNGGNSTVVLPDLPRTPNFMDVNTKGTGEYGSAGRTFDNARNIPVDNPQGIINVKKTWNTTPVLRIGDFHNSHNRITDWIKKTE